MLIAATDTTGEFGTVVRPSDTATKNRIESRILNLTSRADLPAQILANAKYFLRKTSSRRHPTAFSATSRAAITRIEVISLDRAQQRWTRLHTELGQHRDANGGRLADLARRFRAVDARTLDLNSVAAADLVPEYTLAQQFAVDPQYTSVVDADVLDTVIRMTKQEIAIAMSHIAVWRSVAMSDAAFTLVLEDDVYFTRTAGHGISKTWDHIDAEHLDLLFLSFRETSKSSRSARKPAQAPEVGLWQASGYVLSQQGAQKLLAALPMVGPVDLWLNFQFDALHVRVADKPHIEQRPNVPSSNSYSVMPALSKVGAIRHEAPQLVPRRKAKRPIIVTGTNADDLASVGIALSVLGFRTLAHKVEMPPRELQALRSGGRRVFDAYVDLTLPASDIAAAVQRGALHIALDDPSADSVAFAAEPALTLHVDCEPWRQLATLLNVPHPNEPWPDRPARRAFPSTAYAKTRPKNSMRWDNGPWVLPVELEKHEALHRPPGLGWLDAATHLGTDGRWFARMDTFPSNRALFRPENVHVGDHGAITLQLTRSTSVARPLAGAALATTQSFGYGRYGAVLRAAPGSGIVTGVFLHRNGPRQEIDIEILGQRPREMLVNVFYNPGDPGTRLETGYYGTPTRIPLGFDATEDFHRYEIEWTQGRLRWWVDEQLVHERSEWVPTPVPDLPLEFNINLWSSESVRFAGALDTGVLPVEAMVQTILMQPGT